MYSHQLCFFSVFQTVGRRDHRPGRHPRGAGPQPERGSERPDPEDSFRGLQDVILSLGSNGCRNSPRVGLVLYFKLVFVAVLVRCDHIKSNKIKKKFTKVESHDPCDWMLWDISTVPYLLLLQFQCKLFPGIFTF